MKRVFYKNESDFIENCPCAYQILNYIDGIKDTDVKWFFDFGISDYPEDVHRIIFKSYCTPEYKDYVLSLSAEAIDESSKYSIELVKRVDNLLDK